MQETQQDLWKPTPCTIPFVSASPSFARSERFRLFSIYHKDDVHKPKPVFNDVEKPDLLLAKFRREIEEASSDRFKQRNSRRIYDNRSSMDSRKGSKSKLSPDKIITDKLYKIRNRQDSNFDRYGIRSNLETDEKQEFLPRKQAKSMDKTQFSEVKKSRASFLTSSRRLDFSRPLNFYPAPNTYRHVDFLSQRKFIPSPRPLGSLTSRRSSQGQTI